MSREEELDSFWDIESLLPQKKTRTPIRSDSDTATAEIELIPPKKEADQAIARPQPIPRDTARPMRRFIPPHTEEEEQKRVAPQKEYTPENTLIRRVRIYRPRSNYQYYEAFLRDAVRLYPIHGEECPRVPFFSYVPQYSQMNRSQLEWYLWWRECVRRGEYLQTDYSYILLYLYELINLSSRQNPIAVQSAMISVWTNYREMYHQLDGYLSEWICDHGLLHELTVPKDFPRKLLSVAMTHSTFKEFYFSSDSASGYAGALIAFCNNYDYKKSKFYTEHSALFDRVIPTVLNRIVDTVSEEGKLFSATRMDDSRLTRNAFTGALCAYSVKRNIEVEYCSFSRSNELRYLITDVIKYTENLLRAYLGIRSRLTVYWLPSTAKEEIDAFLPTLLPPKPLASKIKREEPRAEYEKMYDLPQTPLSFAHAAEIEQASWSTTERLIEAFSEETETEQGSVPLPAFSVEVPATEEPFESRHTLSASLKPFVAFLRAVMEENTAAQMAAAEQMGKLPDAVADEINEIAAEQMGDILIEDHGDGAYAAIPDYTALIEEVLHGDQ